MNLQETTVYQLQINEEEYDLIKPLQHEVILYRLDLYEIIKISSFKTIENEKIYTLTLLPTFRHVNMWLDNKAGRLDRFTLLDEDDSDEK